MPLLLLIAPYYLNKLIYIADPDFWVFLATDYLNKFLTLTLLYLVMRRASVGLPIPWRFGWPTGRQALAVAIGTVALIALDVFSGDAVTWLNDLSGRLTRYPDAPNALAKYVDDVVGNLLAGFSEETIFRFYLINALLLRGRSRAASVILSTAIFAAIHWSYGLGAVAFAAAAGLLLAATFLATRSLTVPVLIHALYDAVYFVGGVTVLQRWLLD
ncbi:MAG: CPBP family intramembrane glutamic endopeptidase [Pseudomonadota bacterium]